MLSIGQQHDKRLQRYQGSLSIGRLTLARTASGYNAAFQIEQSPNVAAMRFRVEPVVAQPAPPQIRT
jgi:hypothetical protein